MPDLQTGLFFGGHRVSLDNAPGMPRPFFQRKLGDDCSTALAKGCIVGIATRFSSAKKFRSLTSIGRRPGPSCAKMHPSAGRREDSVAAYLRANRADRRRVVGARAPTIRTRDPCHSDIRKPRQFDTLRFLRLLRLTLQARHQIREFAFAPTERSSR